MRVYVVACMNVCISAYLHVLMVLSFISFTTHTHTHTESREQLGSVHVCGAGY